jgi:hypothetical protein
MRATFFAWLFACAVLLASWSAPAAVGIRQPYVPATRLFTKQISVVAGQSVTLSTLNLSPGGDTVLHIQRYPEGTYLAGNDDYSGVASQVSFSAPYTGQLWVIVRSYNDSTFGSGTLRAVVGGSTTDTPITFGGRRFDLGSTMTNGAIYTVQRQGQATDTVLLALSSTEVGAAFDDDDGFDAMAYAWVAGVNKVIVGTYAGSEVTAEYTTFVADEYLQDADGDTLGAALEASINTSDSDFDSDQDGLPDGEELYGYGEWHGYAPNVNLPYYGADPTVRDIFLEADFSVDDPGDPTKNRVHPSNAEGIAASFLSAGIVAHLDIGVANPDPATRLTWGDWGGAGTVSTIAHCTGLTASRVSRFHHILSVGGANSGGGQHADGAPCFTGGQAVPTMAHEIGHFALDHWGHPTDFRLDCNPLYHSTMNQVRLGSGEPHFSNGSWGGTIFPPQLVETGWQGKPWLADLGGAPFHFMVDVPAGKIDWNRDGAYSAGTTKAAPTMVPGSNDCDPSTWAPSLFPGASSAPDSAVEAPALAWVQSSGPISAGRLFVFGRAGGAIRFASTTSSSLANCASSPSRKAACSSWTAFDYVASSSPLLQSPPAAVDIGGDRVLLVYRTYQNLLKYQVGTVNFTTGQVAWTPSATLGGGYTSHGDLAIVRDGSSARLFGAGSVGTLFEWTFQIATSQWSGPAQQGWAGGGVVVLPAVGPTGPAVVSGYKAGDSSPSLFLLVADGVSGALRFGWRSAANTWSEPAGFWNFGPAPTSTQRVSLAYMHPQGGSTPRLFFSFVGASTPDSVAPPFVGFTEGNDASAAATSRRLQVRSAPTFLVNRWGAVADGSSMVMHPTLDSNVRYVFNQPDAKTVFLPLADGIVNSPLVDYNDHETLWSRMGCAVHSCCSSPAACPAWL